MEQPKATVLSKATLFSWGFVATLLLAVFWATKVYVDQDHTKTELAALKNKVELLENTAIQMNNEIIELRTELKFYDSKK